jgi:AcrR family transcriptional regulator
MRDGERDERDERGERDERAGRSDGGVAIVRRAPFSENPRVGLRGQRTQQRILDAALRGFGEAGYHGCSIDQIAKLARCSRVSFYQYFARKEDVFRQLAGQVARQVSASTEALDPLTPDLAGWTAMRPGSRYAEIHALRAGVPCAGGRRGARDRRAVHRRGRPSRIHARLATTTLPPRQLDPVIRLLLECLNHTLDVCGMLRSVGPGGYPAERVEIAITDVLHRTLFGAHPEVNFHPPDGGPPPALESGPAMLASLRQESAVDPDVSGNRALEALLEVGRDVYLERGYHNTRVDDLVVAAGVSHGAFYRYFRSGPARAYWRCAVQAVGAAVVGADRDAQAWDAVLRR